MESIWPIMESYPLMYVQSLAKMCTHHNLHTNSTSSADVYCSREQLQSPVVTKHTDTFLIC